MSRDIYNKTPKSVSSDTITKYHPVANMKYLSDLVYTLIILPKRREEDILEKAPAQ